MYIEGRSVSFRLTFRSNNHCKHSMTVPQQFDLFDLVLFYFYKTFSPIISFAI